MTQSEGFKSCEYAACLKVLSHNKGRQPEPALFRAASTWLQASPGRSDLAKELLGVLDITERAIQALNDCASADLLIGKVNQEVGGCMCGEGQYPPFVHNGGDCCG